MISEIVFDHQAENVDERLERFGEADGYRLPVRIRQGEVIRQVVQRHASWSDSCSVLAAGTSRSDGRAKRAASSSAGGPASHLGPDRETSHWGCTKVVRNGYV